MLAHAIESSRHLLDLINDVLDLSRIEAGRLELELQPVPLAPILEDVRATFAMQVKAKGLDFKFDPADPDLAAVADPARLRQILVNVLGNAIKFTAQGSVSLKAVAPPGRPFVEIKVTDTGIGIAQDRREFLFQKFSQADASTTRRFGGSGLGLVIVKELAEMMGGTVRIDSPGENRGTTVWISLARADATGGEPPAQ
jgi:signal transduction histidine kinase